MLHREVAVSTAMFAEFRPSDFLPLFADNGIAGVEASTNCFDQLTDDTRFDALRGEIERSGVRVWSVHSPFGPDMDISSGDERLRRRALGAAFICLERIVELGGRCLVVHASSEPIEEEDRRRRLARAAESLRELKDQNNEFGPVKIAVENLPRTCLGRTAAELNALLDEVESPHFGVCLDVNHANFRETLPDATRAYGDRIFSLHLSDNDGVDERHWMPGRGVLPWAEWVEALNETAYDGPFLYEAGDPENRGGTVEEANALLADIRRNADTVLFGED